MSFSVALGVCLGWALGSAEISCCFFPKDTHSKYKLVLYLRFLSRTQGILSKPCNQPRLYKYC